MIQLTFTHRSPMVVQAPSGRVYSFDGTYSGPRRIYEVDDADAEYLLSLRRSPCCGRPSTPVLERVG